MRLIAPRVRRLGEALGRALAPLLRVARKSGALLCGCLLLVAAHLGGVLRPLDDSLAAGRAQMIERTPSRSLVIVEIDAESLRAANTWPWPRERFATVIRNLREAGATLIGFDVDFSARSTDADDLALRDAIDADPGSIVLPSFMQPGANVETTPLASLSRNAVLGSVNARLDQDGRVRRYQRGYHHNEHYQASMAAVLAGAPYGETAPFLIDFGIRAAEIDMISFDEVYRGSFDANRVRGRVILVGATALELGDEFSTPIQPSMPGVIIHALAYESLILGRALLEPNGVAVLALAISVLIFLWPRSGPLNLRRILIRQTAVLSVVLLGPLMLQAVAPITANLGLVLLAQASCIAMSTHQELHRRTMELLRAREVHLTFVALHDPETQLPNRRAMMEKVSGLLAMQSGSGVVVAIAFGVDRFPILRGAVGYANANRLIQGLAAHIRECGGQDNVFHISTSILGVVLTALDEEDALRLCADVIKVLDTRIMLDAQVVEMSVHTGSAMSLDGRVAAETLLEHTSLALDQARAQGWPHICYDAERLPNPKVQLALMSDVGIGLTRGDFTLLYQAKASLRGQEIVGAEALMRWRHPTYGAISPDQFIPVAEETGCIDVLTRWVLEQAVRDQALLRTQGVDKFLSINISGRSLADRDFCDFAIGVVQDASARICFEVTETAIIREPLVAISSLAAFRAAGIKISIDDYGAGLSSLSYLKLINADELKLDKSLIQNITTRDRLILKSTIDLAHGLGMSAVAEGVEDEATLAILTTLGCDAVQGYFVGRPGTLEEFGRLCRSAERAAVQKVLDLPKLSPRSA
jgi:EAL domain-containing protein (putative c-di-GMP-specific phosphodiesterase class I)/CHASE2 domain-containing sensor protein/GGDEF domain-containing protein